MAAMGAGWTVVMVLGTNLIIAGITYFSARSTQNAEDRRWLRDQRRMAYEQLTEAVRELDMAHQAYARVEARHTGLSRGGSPGEIQTVEAELDGAEDYVFQAKNSVRRGLTHVAALGPPNVNDAARICATVALATPLGGERSDDATEAFDGFQQKGSAVITAVEKPWWQRLRGS